MRMPLILRIVFFVIITCFEIKAQTEIFPELSGEELLEALVDEYKTQQLLSLTQAKDTLYARVEVRDDSVHGIYTDFTLHLPHGQDPSQALFMGGSGINLEHSWPQSKGAGDGRQGQTDMHHLYPSRVVVNSARGSYPFGEIADHSTEKWYYKAMERSTIPTTDIDFYSESIDGTFEPRESAKGDIARAMFYFYTMYKQDADNADPDFFEAQRSTLCTWHYADPVDDLELGRTQRVASYQGGKVNPFVLDCTLAERAYCPDGGQCETVAVSHTSSTPLDVYLSQNGCNIQLHLNSSSVSNISNSIINSGGQVLFRGDSILSEGEHIIDIDGCHLSQGIYILHSIIKRNGKKQFKTLKFVITGQP